MERPGYKKNQNSINKDTKTLFFVDDQLIVADSEDALQISIHKLQIRKKSLNKRKNSGF